MAARFYLDENVSERVADHLISLGLAATSASRLGHKGRSDPEQVVIAADLDRIFVTYDASDFLLHDAWRTWPATWGLSSEPEHAGILIMYPGKGITAADIADSISQLVSKNVEFRNRLYGWSTQRGWVEVQ